jgi:Mn-dependent DtxR family transcriptional regulator
MKLTRRQEEFVKKMLELRQEFDGPVHYSLLAERLGVSPLTAYDMLCLLEEKGFVASAYQLPSDKNGPGRAERVFTPGRMALHYDQQIMDESGKRLEGEALQEHVLEQLRQGLIPEAEHDLVDQLMMRLLPEGQGDVRYCVEIMTIAALRLQHTPGWQVLLKHLPTLLPGETSARLTDLCLLGGFIFGILAGQNAEDEEWLVKLREHLPGYLTAVMAMGGENREKLADQLIRMFATLD